MEGINEQVKLLDHYLRRLEISNELPMEDGEIIKLLKTDFFERSPIDKQSKDEDIAKLLKAARKRQLSMARWKARKKQLKDERRFKEGLAKEEEKQLKLKMMLVHTMLIYNRMSLIHMILVSNRLISNTEPEVTVICVDNSCLLTDEFRGGGAHKAQARAIALYCEEKIKAHPRNLVALLAMGMLKGSCFIRPTRDLHHIRFALRGLMYTGQASIPMGHALNFFNSCPLPKRRLLVFFGGRLSMDSDELQFCAKRFKDYKVAVDVVNFGIQYLPKTKKKLLQEFVETADNLGNSHYLYAPNGSTTSLCQQIFSSPLAPGGLPMQEEMKKKEEVEKHKMAIAKMKKKKLHMTKNLSSVLAPGGLSMREVKKKEKQVTKMDNKEKQAKRKEELAKKEEERFWAFMRLHSFITYSPKNDRANGVNL